MSIRTQVEGGVATLTLDHPPLNILGRAVLAELRAALAALAADAEVRALLLVAAGKHFSAGADVGEHFPPEYRDLIPEFMETIEQLAAFPLPVIASVRGRCLGGGFELAMAADVIVAADNAQFGQPEILLGVTAPAACVLLPRRTRHGFAAEVLYTGDPVSATRAHAAGIVQHVVPEADADAEALAIARRIARHSGAALRQAKRTVGETATLARGAALREAGRIYVDEVMKAEDALEGLTAFTEKRAPQWRNR